jgi:hypothetical protein
MATLEAYRGRELVFTSDRHWLYPLLDLEQHLSLETAPSKAELYLVDRVIGRAAALFMVQLGVDRVHAGVLSRRAQPVLEQFGIPYTCDEVVERIACRTEELLGDEWSPERAAAWIRERAERVSAS